MCSVVQLARLASAAMVARVVATSEASDMGIGPPVRTASKKASSWALWPLSGARHARLVFW